jgi:betaine-aldehyde dehydrogenase
MTDTRTLKNFVGGEYTDTADGRYYDLVNPSTGGTFATAPASREADVDAAFRVADRAFESWRETMPSERQLALIRIADAL